MKALVSGFITAIVCFGCSDVPDTTSFPSSGGSGGGASSGAAGSSAGLANGGSLSSGGAGAAGPVAGSGVSAGTGGGGAAGIAGSAGAAPVGGEAIFNVACKSCHEAQGVGGKLAPEIQHLVRDHATWVVRNGLPGAAFPKPMEKLPADLLSDADLNMIFDYLDKPAQPTSGQALYLDYCGNCHGADGKGGPTTRNILDELDKLRENVEKGTHAGDFGNRKEYMPVLNPAKLTDAEVDLIYAYVESL